MSEIDTSTETAERLAKRLKRDIDWRSGSLCADAAATLRALAAERDRWYADAELQRIANVTVTAERDAARAEVARLREALRSAAHEAAGAEAIDSANVLARRLMRIQDIARAALAQKEPRHD